MVPWQLPAELVALQVVVVPSRRLGGEGMVANEVEALSVQCICSRLRRHVYRTRRSQVIREIQRRLTQLKFVDRACRNVCRDRTDGFVRDVYTVDVNTCRPSKSAAERN